MGIVIRPSNYAEPICYLKILMYLAKKGREKRARGPPIFLVTKKAVQLFILFFNEPSSDLLFSNTIIPRKKKKKKKKLARSNGATFNLLLCIII